MDDNPRPNNQTPKKSFELRGSWLVALAAVFLILIGVAVWSNHHNKSGTASTQVTRRDQRAGDISAKFNQAATIGNLNLTVTQARITDYSAPDTPPRATGAQPPQQYLIADVTLSGNSKTPTTYSYNQFSLLSDSKTYAAIPATALPLAGSGVATPLGSGSLSTGQKISGQVIMPLPLSYKYYYVVFTPKQDSNQRVVAGP
jgi:hypothetical protein